MHKEGVYIQGFAQGRSLPLTLKALNYATLLHSGQTRDDGADTIEHPTKVCRYLMNHRIRHDDILAASLLHDTIEDTEITKEELQVQFGENVATIVDLLSKKEQVPAEIYYKEMAKDIRAIIIKAADRACNVDDMTEVFTVERLEKYVKDTEENVLPMMKQARRVYLDYSDALVSFRDQIRGILKVVKKKVIPLSRENTELKNQLAKK